MPDGSVDRTAAGSDDQSFRISFDYTHDEDRKAAVKANVLKYKIPMFLL